MSGFPGSGAIAGGEGFIKGMTQALESMAALEGAMLAEMTAAGEELAEALTQWAKEEHPWSDESGDTAANTEANVTEITADEVTVTLLSLMEGRSTGSSGGASFWLELCRNGEWAWLMDVVNNHVDDIQGILESHGLAGLGSVERVGFMENYGGTVTGGEE